MTDKKRGRPKGSKNKPKESEVEKYEHVVEDFTMNRKGSVRVKMPVKAKKNIWKDDGEIGEEEFDNVVKRKSLTPCRERVKERTIKCSICNKEVKIPPSLLVSEYYRCEKCVGR